jgi:hypothetical protein
MANDSADIDALIASYEVKIAALQEAVAALRKAKDALEGASLSTGVAGATATRPAEIGPDTFTGLTILQAAERYLRMVGRPARTTEEIVEAVARGGLQKASPGSVATILIRSHNGEGPVVRVQKGLFGLADWYPKRPPKTKGSAKGVSDDATDDVDAAEPEAS